MQLLAAIQAMFAFAFLLVGVVALFGIGITGLVFLLPGALFAAIAGVVADRSRAAVAAALGADAVLAWMAARQLGTLLATGAAAAPLGHAGRAMAASGPLDYLLPCAVLVLVVTGAIATAADWRALRAASWF